MELAWSMQPLGKANIQLMEVDYLSIQLSPSPFPCCMHAHTHKPGQNGTNIPLNKITGNAYRTPRETLHACPPQPWLAARGEEWAAALTGRVPRQLQLQLLHLFDQE